MNMKILKIIFIFLLLPAAVCAKNHADIAKENAPSVVTVNVLKKDGAITMGTGFIVAEHGVIAAAEHVVRDSLYINVTFATGVSSAEAAVIAASTERDLALLRIEAQNLPAVTLADSDYVCAGDRITIIGHPWGLQNTVTSGLVSQVRQLKDGMVMHQISAAIAPSSSGSPVFNKRGEVVSVAVSGHKEAQGGNFNFAVPSNYLAELMKSAAVPVNPAAPEVPGFFTRTADYLRQCANSAARHLNLKGKNYDQK